MNKSIIILFLLLVPALAACKDWACITGIPISFNSTTWNKTNGFVILADTNDWVGIGEILPEHLLDIQENTPSWRATQINVSLPLIRLDRLGNYEWDFGLDNNTYTGYSDFIFRDASTRIIPMLIKAISGFVGIGNIIAPNRTLDVNGTSRFGYSITTPTNYTETESDGTLVFNGDATVWKDINLGAALLSPPQASAPTIDEFKDNTGTDTGIETYSFSPGEKVSGEFEIQHDYKEGSNFTFHVHWQGITAPAGGTDNVRWQLIYTISRDGVTLAPTTTITSQSAFTTQYAFVRTDFTAISGTGIQIGDQFLFQLSRIAATADEYAGDALIATAGIHYEIDTVGSRYMTTK